MSNTLKGTIKLIEETQQFSSGFTKREFVVTTNEKYPQDIKLEMLKDNCAILDSVTTGQEVTVHYNLRGNEYNGKYYVNLVGWKLEKGEGWNQEEAPNQSEHVTNIDDGDDIPF